MNGQSCGNGLEAQRFYWKRFSRCQSTFASVDRKLKKAISFATTQTDKRSEWTTETEGRALDIFVATSKTNTRAVASELAVCHNIVWGMSYMRRECTPYK